MENNQSPRTIIVVSTESEAVAQITSQVATWGELSNILVDKGYDLSNLSAMTDSKVTLEHPDAVLPTGPFRVYLKAKDAKGGSVDLEYSSMSFSELRAQFTTPEEIMNLENYIGKDLRQASKPELVTYLTMLQEEEGIDEERDLEDVVGNLSENTVLTVLNHGADFVKLVSDFKIAINKLDTPEMPVNNLIQIEDEDLEDEFMTRFYDFKNEINHFLSFLSNNNIQSIASSVDAELMEEIRRDIANIKNK